MDDQPTRFAAAMTAIMEHHLRQGRSQKKLATDIAESEAKANRRRAAAVTGTTERQRVQRWERRLSSWHLGSVPESDKDLAFALNVIASPAQKELVLTLYREARKAARERKHRDVEESPKPVREEDSLMGDHINIGAHGAAIIKSTVTDSTVGSSAATSNQYPRYTQNFIADLREKVDSTGDETAIYAVDILDAELQKPQPNHETVLKTIPRIQRAVPSFKQDPRLAAILDGIVELA